MAYFMRATKVSVQNIMLVVPMMSSWVGGSENMLAKTYSGEVPTSPKMMPMALHAVNSLRAWQACLSGSCF